MYSIINTSTFWTEFIITYAVMLVICGFLIFCDWKLFTKAGKKGWKCIIPVYNLYMMFDIVYGNGWRFLLLLIPVANIVFSIMYYVDLAKAYGKSGAFGIGLVFLPYIFIPILALGDAEYEGTVR